MLALWLTGDLCWMKLDGIGFSPPLAHRVQVASSQYHIAMWCTESVSNLCWVVVRYLDEVDVVLSAGQLCDLAVSPLQISDLVAQTLHVALRVVECCPLVGGDQLGHLLLHPLNGAYHVAKRLLTFLQCSLGWVLHRKHGCIPFINRVSHWFYQRSERSCHHYHEGMCTVCPCWFNFPFNLEWLVWSYLSDGWWWYKPWVSQPLVSVPPSAWVGHESSPGSQPGWRPAVAVRKTADIVDDGDNIIWKKKIISLRFF